MSHARIQLQLIVIWIHNLVFNLLPFFALKNSYLRLTGAKIGRGSYVHTWARFTRPSRFWLGNNSTVNFGCFLDTRGEIHIGNNVMLGHNCKIYTAGHNIDDQEFTGYVAPVIIEDNAVVFPNSIIMPNVTIETGAVIYPGSVVTKSVPSYSVVGGNPAQVIRQRKAREFTYKLEYSYWLTNV